MRSDPLTNNVTSVTCFTPTKKYSTDINRPNRDRTSSFRSSSNTTNTPSPYEETLRSNQYILSKSSKKIDNNQLMPPGSSSPSSLRSLVNKLSTTSPIASQKSIRNTPMKRNSLASTTSINKSYRPRSPTPTDKEIPENRTTEEILQFLECQRDESESEVILMQSKSTDPFSNVYANSDVVSSIWDEPKTPLHHKMESVIVHDINPSTPTMTSIPSHEIDLAMDSSPLVSTCSSDALIDTQETNSQLHIPALNHKLTKPVKELNEISQGNQELTQTYANKSLSIQLDKDESSDKNQSHEGQMDSQNDMNPSIIVEQSSSGSNARQHNASDFSIHGISKNEIKGNDNCVIPNSIQAEIVPCSLLYENSKPQDATLASCKPLSTVNLTRNLYETDGFHRLSPEVNNMTIIQLVKEREHFKEQFEKIDQEFFTTVSQEYNLIYQQYHEIKCEKEAINKNLKHLENEVERLQHVIVTTKGQNEMMSPLDLEQAHNLKHTIEVNKRRIGYLSNENQKLRKENSEWRELCQELMSIIEGKEISKDGSMSVSSSLNA